MRKTLDGDRRSLARLFTRIERNDHDLRNVMRQVHPHTGNTYCVGVTGPPGAGKSTLVDALVTVARNKGLKVGVLAVDPTSPFSGGAVLGDRIRMQNHYLDRDVFIRSLATRGVHGGLSHVSSAAVRLLDAVGKDLVIVETVGVGQTELDIMGIADTVVVTMVPEAGDAVQAMKAGLMEIADIYVVNKADRDGARQLATAIRGMLSLNPPSESNWQPPILLTQAHKGEGVAELYNALGEHHTIQQDEDTLDDRRRQRRRQEFTQAVTETLTATLTKLMNSDSPLSDILNRVESGDLDPYTAAMQSIRDGNLATNLGQAIPANSDDSD
ncbi:MAG: methylmalonyl Co-A mutase-associated GTPase MeaB [SAR202 cluster bacterium]|nr:methylmalonyl Co-A mutase-associated GTPase MeaB [SAR202 cluster bacterium]MDP6511907.1 methylmalonyl Co-A mutase-associated GTPase MeaB [SAR202 cluster bacterium]